MIKVQNIASKIEDVIRNKLSKKQGILKEQFSAQKMTDFFFTLIKYVSMCK